MQLALKESAVLAMDVPKRGLMAFAVKVVLGVPALWDLAADRWYVYSDPSISWSDVQHLIAVVEHTGNIPDPQGPPDGFPDVLERRNIGPRKASWDAAQSALRGWARSRLPDFPPDDDLRLGVTTLEEWFGRPWLRINSTAGMVRYDPDPVVLPS